MALLAAASRRRRDEKKTFVNRTAPSHCELVRWGRLGGPCAASLREHTAVKRTQATGQLSNREEGRYSAIRSHGVAP
ncbi:MAG: hypothetical protein D6725_06220 [Planctomycetota bacterium]|nr:MAG: hypothetical protein D6725_06220 [Planctomycetota bacterium]